MSKVNREIKFNLKKKCQKLKVRMNNVFKYKIEVSAITGLLILIQQIFI